MQLRATLLERAEQDGTRYRKASGMTHRFHNPGIQPAKMVFICTPGGPESLFHRGRRRAAAGRAGSAMGAGTP